MSLVSASLPSPRTVRIRELPDFDAAASVLKSVYETDGYPVEGIADPLQWLSPPGLLCSWVALQDNRIIGHVLVTDPKPGDAAVKAWNRQGGDADRVAAMGRLFVDRDARGKGFGRLLTEAAISWAGKENKRLVLDVIEKDVSAIALYEKLGWRKIGTSIHDNGAGKHFNSLLYLSPELNEPT